MDATREPLIVAYSYGVDSTAILVGLYQRGIRPDVILFADLGSEKIETYEYQAEVDGWLKRIGWPPVTVVRRVPPRAPYRTIEGNMVQNCTLPGATFGKGSCTMSWKIDPQNKHCNGLPICRAAWAAGLKVRKLIGFEAGEEYRERRACDRAMTGDDPKYRYEYPLIEWGWTRSRCLAEIAAAGLAEPPKSACFFCPNQKPAEVDALTAEERGRIVRMERNAAPYNRKVDGLWRRTRKSDGRPGSITAYIVQRGLDYVDPAELDCRDPMPMNPNCHKPVVNDRLVQITVEAGTPLVVTS